MCAPTTIYVDRIDRAWCVSWSDSMARAEPSRYPDSVFEHPQVDAFDHAHHIVEANPGAILRVCELSRPEDIAGPPIGPLPRRDTRMGWLALSCTRCQSTDPMGWIQATDGHLVCGNCESDHYVTCRHCSATTPADEPGRDEHDQIPDDVCASCFEWNSSECAVCACTFHVDDLEDGVCDDCRDSHWQCAHCDDWQSENDDSWTTDVGAICESCYYLHYFMCIGCESVLHNDDYSHNGLCDGCATDCDCDNCQSERDDDGGNSDLWRDDALDALGFVGPAPIDNLWLGIELEVEVEGSIGDAAEETGDAFGRDFIVVKEDGSLNHGFEINTPPASLDTHRKRWDRAKDDLPSNLRSWDTSTCGMHVHADRRALTEFGWGKVICLFNAPDNLPLFECIAGRSRNASYARHNGSCATVKPTHGKRRHRGYYGRYVWVNTQPGETVEFRLFKGTLNRIGYQKNVECIHAAVTYCRGAGLSQLTATDFLAWLDRPERRKDYPALTEFLGRKGHLRPVPPAPAPDEIARRRAESKARKLAARAALCVQPS